MSTNARDLSGRFMLVTGANTGIGRVTAERLAGRGAHVVLACRSEARTQPVLDAIHAAGGSAEWVELDLADLDQVRACAARIAGLGRPIDALLNNAGLGGRPGSTKQGFELTFGTNHLGHFLLTALLAPRLIAAAPSRIVNVASRSHFDARKGIDFAALRQPTKSLTALPEYAVSKLCNVLFTGELAARIGSQGVHSYALHPGVVASDIWRRIPWPIRPIMNLFMVSNEQGAQTSLYCATSPEVAEHDGRYYDGCRERRPSRFAQDAALAKELWQRSVEWTGADVPS